MEDGAIDSDALIDNPPAEVDQDAIVDDWATEELIPQELTKEEYAKYTNPENKSNPEPGKEAEPTVKTENITKPPLQPYSDEKGNFSPEKWAEHDLQVRGSLKGLPEKFEPTIDPALQQEQKQEEQKPIHVRVREESAQHIEAIRTNLTKPLQSAYAYFKQGLDAETALQRAYSETEAWIKQEQEQFEYNRKAELEDEAYKLRQESEQSTAIQQKAASNTMEVAAEYGGIDKLNSLLQDSKLAGKYILQDFHGENEGKKFASHEAYAKAIDSWWAKKAQNPDNIRKYANIGYMAEVYNNTPKIYAHMKQSVMQSVQARKASVVAPTRTITNQPAKQQPDALDGFLGR